MDALKIDRTKLYTQSAYAKKLLLSPARINQKIKNGDLETVKINGATLVYEK